MSVKLVSPWVDFYREIEAMFGDDPDIKIDYISDTANPVVKLFVTGTDKAEALEQLLPSERTFGSVTVSVAIVPANVEQTRVGLFRRAFANNPAFSFAATVDGAFTNPISYVVFRNKVVQYYNDDLGDVNGNRSTLYQEIAKDLFGEGEGIFFCTDTPDNLGLPKDAKD